MATGFGTRPGRVWRSPDGPGRNYGHYYRFWEIMSPYANVKEVKDVKDVTTHSIMTFEQLRPTREDLGCVPGRVPAASGDPGTE